MPVEIRELIIKTEIFSSDRNHLSGIREEDFRALKKQVLEECKKMIAEGTKKRSHNR